MNEEQPQRDVEPSLAEDLNAAWPVLSLDERLEGFRLFSQDDAEEFFGTRMARDQQELILALKPAERRRWMRFLDPDDAADVIQEAPAEHREALLALLDDASRREVRALMVYAEDDAGGLMSPRFARVRPEMTVDEALAYVRRQARERVETVYYVYVLDERKTLLGVVSFRELITTPSGKLVRDIMETDLITAHEEMDQEALGLLFAQHDLIAVPVVDETGALKGIVTVDDIVDVVTEEATEDAHKYGGMQALDAPYLEVGLWSMVKKRGGWLTVLFVGEMLTIGAMGHFQDALAKAVVLSLFIPMIIASGGNSGSQASTLVVRAMALDEVRLRDWWRVLSREILSGLSLGCVLGTIGMAAVAVMLGASGQVAAQLPAVALTVACSLVGVVLWGTLAGSMLPFVLRRAGFDPASASAPLVSTLVDVVGLVIYFSTAAVLLQGRLL